MIEVISQRAWLALAVLLLAGCAGFHQGAVEPTDHTAVLHSGQWGKVYRGGYVEIAGMNGETTGWRLRSDLELTPGKLAGVFFVYLCTQAEKHCNSIAEARMTFEALAGHSYEVRAREQINGSNRFWVWVVDESDKQVVGCSRDAIDGRRIVPGAVGCPGGDFAK